MAQISTEELDSLLADMLISNKSFPLHHVISGEEPGIGIGRESGDNEQQQEKFVEQLNQRLYYDRQKRARPRDYATLLRQYNSPKYTYSPTRSVYYYHNMGQKQTAPMTTTINQRFPVPQKVPPPSPARNHKLPLTPRTNYWLGLYQASLHLNGRGKDTLSSINLTKTTRGSDWSMNNDNDNSPSRTKQYASLQRRGETNNDYSAFFDRNLAPSNNSNHKLKTFNRLPLVKQKRQKNNNNSYYNDQLPTTVKAIVQPETFAEYQTLIADRKRLLENRTIDKKHLVVSP